MEREHPAATLGCMSEFWTNFWSFIWLFFWGFALVAYLFAVFTVVGDLFRDRALNGWWKALWIACLVFVPFLTVLAYVVTRGSGLVDRLDSRPRQGIFDGQAQPAASTSTEPTRAYTHAYSPATEIAHAKNLLDEGAITRSEFELLKNGALAGTR
jgi:hypothetical protein